MADAAGRPLWDDTAPPPPPTAPLTDDIDADVAIIGAGILGLAAGLTLQRGGRRVVVLEAHGIGAGASGRNGGLVVPSLPRIGPAEVRRRLGPEVGGALLHQVAGAAARVFALIREEAIACDAVQSGWLMPAHAASLASGVAARTDAWAKEGAACVFLDAAGARRRMGTPHVYGALLDATGGHLDPLGYTRGLAAALLRAGGRICTGSPVTRVEPGWVLHAGSGRVRAGMVLQATNAQPSPLRDPVRAATVKLLVYQLATDPLPLEQRGRLLAGNEAFSDTRNNLLACRWTAGGRLVTGGMAGLHRGAFARLPPVLARRLAAVFPGFGVVRFPYVWRGQATLTGDFLPRLFRLAPGWLAPVACNGRGIALSTVLGESIARALLGRGEMPLPLTEARAMPLHALAAALPQLLLPLGDWRDRRA